MGCWDNLNDAIAGFSADAEQAEAQLPRYAEGDPRRQKLEREIHRARRHVTTANEGLLLVSTEDTGDARWMAKYSELVRTGLAAGTVRVVPPDQA